MAIRSGGVYDVGDWSLPPAVQDEGRRNVGNREECRLRHDYASSRKKELRFRII